jgi:L-threonylcarbamoyladenylate synthase
MKILPIDQKKIDQDILSFAVKFLRNEEVIIHPTETVYGIAGRYNSERALLKIIDIKSRQTTQPFSIMVDAVDQILNLSGQESPWLHQLLTRLFPNPLTVLLPRKKKLGVPYWDQFPMIGFRCPDHPWSRALIQHDRIPLITTSANISGNQPASTIAEISSDLLSEVSLVLDGGVTLHRLPSTIIKIDEERKKVELIRSGATPWKNLQKIVNNSS